MLNIHFISAIPEKGKVMILFSSLNSKLNKAMFFTKTTKTITGLMIPNPMGSRTA